VDIAISSFEYVPFKSPNAKLFVHFPLAATSFLTRSNNTPVDLLKISRVTSDKRAKKCLLVASNKAPNQEGCLIREQTAQLLGCDRCCNRATNGAATEHHDKGRSFLDDAVSRYKDYRFAVVMENTYARGYVTEKIVNAFLASSIPIYWGHPDVFRYFNRKAFIYAPDFHSIQALVEYVEYVDKDPVLYRQYLNEPITNRSQWERLFWWSLDVGRGSAGLVAAFSSIIALKSSEPPFCPRPRRYDHAAISGPVKYRFCSKQKISDVSYPPYALYGCICGLYPHSKQAKPSPTVSRFANSIFREFDVISPPAIKGTYERSHMLDATAMFEARTWKATAALLLKGIDPAMELDAVGHQAEHGGSIKGSDIGSFVVTIHAKKKTKCGRGQRSGEEN
jgi:hypothetical protein